MSDNGADWVNARQRVAAIGGQGRLVDTGHVIAYTDKPTVTIRTDGGENLHWIVAMCRPIPDPCRAIEGNTGLECDRPAGHEEWHSGRQEDLWVQWPQAEQLNGGAA